MEQYDARKLRAQLQSLRPILLNEGSQSFLKLFDEFIEHYEFGLALHVVCDYILKLDSPKVSTAIVEQIRQLHITMKIIDGCVEGMRAQKS